jgi:hypothetical protein
MKHLFLSILLTLLFPVVSFSQPCIDTVAYDNIETFDWFGAWFVFPPTTGYFTNASVSPSTSAVIYGNGGGTSAYESDWYVLPPISVNPIHEHKFSFRLGSYRFTSTGSTSGVDIGDYITVQLSTDGGFTYTNEIRITGFSNAYWNYNSATAAKTANGTLTTFSPTAGGNRTTTGDGYSVIELTVPFGVSSIAIDIFCRANANGEEWWLDNFLLEEIDYCDPLPITLLSFTGKEESGRTRLDWKTASEINNDYFIIERSTDGIYWNEIIRTNGAGSSQLVLSYTEYDFSPFAGINYYRLTQVDYDGQSETFNIIAVDIKDPFKACSDETFYDLNGKEVDIKEVPAGVYLRKCGNSINKIVKQ